MKSIFLCNKKNSVENVYADSFDKLPEVERKVYTSEEVIASIAGIAATLRDHISKNGKSQPSHDPQPLELGKQICAHVVDGHGDQGDKF